MRTRLILRMVVLALAFLMSRGYTQTLRIAGEHVDVCYQGNRDINILSIDASQSIEGEKVFERPKSIMVTVQPWKGSGIPNGWQPTSPDSHMHICAGSSGRSRMESGLNRFDPDGKVNDLASAMNAAKTQTTATIGIGRTLVANNLTDGAPADNAMAISNSGFIVSADNSTIDYYQDTPDTLVQFQFHHDFFEDTLLYNLPFDPRVIYDRYANRFIVVMAYRLVDDSNLLLSFSKTDDPRDGWNHYVLDADTLDPGEWIDYPQIAVNRNELFITGNMTNDNGGDPTGNKLYQIAKQNGYDSLPLNLRIWPDILDADGQPGIFLCPFSDGLMAESYASGIYLASTELISFPQMGTKLYWYHLTDSIGAVGATVNSYQLSSGQPYSVPPVGEQLGSSDYLDLGNCRIHSGFHLSGKLYFVYCKNTNNYCTVVLNRVHVQSNTLQRDSWGFSAGQQDDSYPSIAFLGVDSLDDGKLLMCFQRSGHNIFPQMRAVYFDSIFSANSMLVRQGDGFLDLNPSAGADERFGDYTMTQRRYGTASPSCWAIAAYTVGQNGNYFNSANGLNAFVAEFTDSLANEIIPTEQEHPEVLIFPTPAVDWVNVKATGNAHLIQSISLMDLQGREKQIWHGNWADEPILLNVANHSAGLYFLCVEFKRQNYAFFKIILN
jgi:hypothetical protein